MKIKRTEIIQMFNGLQKLGNLEGVKFSYAIVKTAKILSDEIYALKESIKSSDAFNEYERKRLELCNKYCSKDEAGKPLMKDGYFVGLDKNTDFIKEIETLKEKFKETLEARKKQEQEYAKMLDEEVDVDIYQISLEDVPKNITVEQMAIIEKLIKEQ